jgi:hypothetical protein
MLCGGIDVLVGVGVLDGVGDTVAVGVDVAVIVGVVVVVAVIVWVGNAKLGAHADNKKTKARNIFFNVHLL